MANNDHHHHHHSKPVCPCGLPSTSDVPSMPKPPAHRLPYKMWAIHHPTPVQLSPLVHSNWSSEKDWDGTKQKERERISKIIRKAQKKITEEERKKGRMKKVSYYIDHVHLTYLMLSKFTITNPLAPAPEEREKTQEKQQDNVTNCYLPNPYKWPAMKRKMPQL